MSKASKCLPAFFFQHLVVAIRACKKMSAFYSRNDCLTSFPALTLQMRLCQRLSTLHFVMSPREIQKESMSDSPITKLHFSWPLLALPIDTPHIGCFPYDPLILFAGEHP
jgi:hypothetical protein